MELLWVILAVLVIIGGGIAALRKRGYESVEEEPWRASLDSDEPLDMDEIARAEEEFRRGEPWSDEEWEEEPWK